MNGGPVIPSSTSSIQPLVATREIVVFCGSGGVGKTSIAAASGLATAKHVGGKVLVLTIDPARRLASALGLEGIGNVERPVPEDALKAAGIELRGELYVAMLDTKQSWDELVIRHAPDEETVHRILENSLYRNLTGRFVQSHDYIAMERLFDLHSTGTYDLIVVDTPPTRNALDFLDAPARMVEFFGGRLVRWLTLPYRAGGGRGARVINVASRPFYQLADRILGSQFLQDIAEFFLSFQSMHDGFVERARAVERLLRDRRSAFAVVTTLEGAPLREAEVFCRELVARDFQLGALVLNKTLPPYLLDPAGSRAASTLEREAEPIAESLAELSTSALDDPQRTMRVLRTVADSFANFAVVATREAELRSELVRGPEVVANVPNEDRDISDLEGLDRLAAHLFGS